MKISTCMKDGKKCKNTQNNINRRKMILIKLDKGIKRVDQLRNELKEQFHSRISEILKRMKTQNVKVIVTVMNSYSIFKIRMKK